MIAVSQVSHNLLNRGPRPTVRQGCDRFQIWRGWLFVFRLSLGPGSPNFKQSLQKLFAGLVGAAFAVGLGGFGFYEAAFDGGFEDGGFVAFA